MSFRPFEYETAPEKHFNSETLRLSKILPNLSNRDRLLMLNSLFQMWKISNKAIDSLHFSIFADALSIGGDLDVDIFLKVCNSLDSIQIVPQNHNIELLAEYSKAMKQDNKVVGLKFGFYRRLTISQMYELLVARDNCHKLLLVAESEERTKVFKTARVEYDDITRLKLFKRSCLFDGFALTSGGDFTNTYYRNIISAIKPNVLYASADWGEDTISEYKVRAGLVGAQLIVLPKLTDYSTTKMERLIF